MPKLYTHAWTDEEHLEAKTINEAYDKFQEDNIRHSYDKFKEENNVVLEDILLGNTLQKSEYEALSDIAIRYGETTPENFYSIEDSLDNACLEIEDNHVINLDLYKQDLDMIPEYIQEFTHLKKLILSNNNIDKIQNLDKNTRLSKLDLANNNISRIQNLDKNKRLKKLYLTNNDIGRIQNLDKNKQLKRLDLENNNIDRIENLENNTRLRRLYLGNNNIKRIQNLDKNKRLRKLYLGDNNIDKIQDLDDNTRLERLDLEDNNIDYSLPQNKERYEKLQKEGVSVFR